ncbi:superoxide dismutase, Cu-Zn family [Oryzomicrobium terrae]|uniref:Superoxide dismutase [Cu-Zn] n=1 Tax=Oryzomicrobium terrae TaxID=1735038 RepID=A0A5C1E6X0_9RHOO|nr:superoxide dismutase family protein [Oryzomicrobium terrae]QEL64329.1 superoxide dismutase, Cu-Zn family [Oryzomicrobium terrae]
MKRITLIACSLATVLTAACASTPPDGSARAVLAPSSGSKVSGEVVFTSISGGVRVEARATGLTPGEHGFHVHEVGDCSAPDGTSAKGHFNPTGKAHGNSTMGEHHAGDIPNLVADGSGVVRQRMDVMGMSLEGPTGIMGRAIVIHADPDDYKSQPAGNSGKRVACGVIR